MSAVTMIMHSIETKIIIMKGMMIAAIIQEVEDILNSTTNMMITETTEVISTIDLNLINLKVPVSIQMENFHK